MTDPLILLSEIKKPLEKWTQKELHTLIDGASREIKEWERVKVEALLYMGRLRKK
jgi:hypothetical protein